MRKQLHWLYHCLLILIILLYVESLKNVKSNILHRNINNIQEYKVITSFEKHSNYLTAIQSDLAIDKPDFKKDFLYQLKDYSYNALLATIIGLSTGYTINQTKYLISRLDIIRKYNRLTRLYVPLVGSILICLTYYLYQGLTIGPSSLFNYNEFNGSNNTNYIASTSNLSNPSKFSFTRQILRNIAVIVAIGTGNPIALAGPAAEAGMALSRFTIQLLSNRQLLNKYQFDSLILCGSCAGFAANFNTPISGVLYALEVSRKLVVNESKPSLSRINKDYIIRLIYLLISTITSVYVVRQGQIHSYVKHILSTSNYIVPYTKLSTIYPLALLGLVTGILSSFFESIFRSNTAIIRSYISNIPIFIRPIFAGLITVISEITLGQSQALSDGFNYLKIHADGLDSNIHAVQYLIMKVLSVGISVSSGIIGGIVAPSLFIGGSLGHVFHYYYQLLLFYFNKIAKSLSLSPLLWVNSALVQTTLSPSVYVITGAVAMLGCVFRAPFTSIALVLELSRDPALILPASLVTSVALYSSEYVNRVIHNNRNRNK